jgi:hypothetical protein
VYRERKKSCAIESSYAAAAAAGWKKKKILIMYFNDQKWAYISGLLKFWGLPNFGGLKPLLK